MMIFKYSLLEHKWRPLTGFSDIMSKKILLNITAELDSWEGTPYMGGQQVKGQFVDCVRFLTGVYDNLFKIKRSKPPRLYPDCCIHSPKDAWNALQLVLDLYSNQFERVTDLDLEPGDFIVVGPKNGGPGHGMIVGYKNNTLWHCVFPGVHWTGWALTTNIHKIFRIYRAKDRTLWA